MFDPSPAEPPERADAAPPPLAGRRVTATSVPAGHTVTGVMLPPAGGLLRLHPDGGEPPLELDPARWQVRPEVSVEESRRIHCSDGLLIYRHDDLPAAQLATATMLRHLRRRPAAGQQPLAVYPTRKGYAPLFAVADSAELPPLPPARHAAWELARTCARCGTRGQRPLGKARQDGQRYCEACQEPVGGTA
ncbi:hypothetical protein [Streptosporangium sp. CA-115845]|uniref:hypothetical protein n=1 Tax=Streptosporangium sp. CA-115845 TaxID=3240071 RepID=UPI003D8B7215